MYAYFVIPRKKYQVLQVTPDLILGLEFLESLRKIRQLVTPKLFNERGILLGLLEKKLKDLKVLSDAYQFKWPETLASAIGRHRCL